MLVYRQALSQGLTPSLRTLDRMLACLRLPYIPALPSVGMPVTAPPPFKVSAALHHLPSRYANHCAPSPFRVCQSLHYLPSRYGLLCPQTFQSASGGMLVAVSSSCKLQVLGTESSALPAKHGNACVHQHASGSTPGSMIQ